MRLSVVLPIRATFRWFRVRCFNQHSDVCNVPEAIRNTCCHRRCYAQCLMDADEVVIHHVQRDRVSMVFDLLGKAIGQAGEAAHVHPHSQVLAFDVAGRNVISVRATLDGALANASAFGGAVAARCGDRRAIHFHQLRGGHRWSVGRGEQGARPGHP
jgi:hypothetical protein